MINWKIRFKNKLWVMGFLSQLFIVIEILLVGAHSIGITDFQLTDAIKGEINGWILTLVNTVFALMSTIANIQDPTVAGLGDSERALKRDEPLKKS